MPETALAALGDHRLAPPAQLELAQRLRCKGVASLVGKRARGYRPHTRFDFKRPMPDHSPRRLGSAGSGRSERGGQGQQGASKANGNVHCSCAAEGRSGHCDRKRGVSDATLMRRIRSCGRHTGSRRHRARGERCRPGATGDRQLLVHAVQGPVLADCSFNRRRRLSAERSALKVLSDQLQQRRHRRHHGHVCRGVCGCAEHHRDTGGHG